MSSWYPFPFPACPSCSRSWSTCTHLGCTFAGELVVEPWHEEVKCKGCKSKWRMDRTEFHCNCGHVFGSGEVRGALDEVIRATQALHAELVRRSEELRSVRAHSDASFSAFLGTIASSVGGAAGFVIGKLVKLIFGK